MALESSVHPSSEVLSLRVVLGTSTLAVNVRSEGGLGGLGILPYVKSKIFVKRMVTYVRLKINMENFKSLERDFNCVSE